MRYWITRSAAALLAVTLLAVGVAGQTKKTKKKRSTHRQSAVTTQRPEQVLQGSIPPPSKLEGPSVPPITAEQTPSDGVRRVTPQEARELFDKGKAIIVDVRGEDSYKAGHAKGALLIPINEVESRIKELPRNKMIITYCS